VLLKPVTPGIIPKGKGRHRPNQQTLISLLYTESIRWINGKLV